MAAGFLEVVGQEMAWRVAAGRLILLQEEGEGRINTHSPHYTEGLSWQVRL